MRFVLVAGSLLILGCGNSAEAPESKPSSSPEEGALGSLDGGVSLDGAIEAQAADACPRGTCAAPLEDGAPCKSTPECREGSYCGATSESSGTWCIAYLPAGAPCFSGGLSISAACGPGLVCSAQQNGTCVSKN